MAQKIAFIMPVVIMWRRSRSSAVLKIQFRFLFKSGYLLSNPYPFYKKKKRKIKRMFFFSFFIWSQEKKMKFWLDFYLFFYL